MASATPLLHTSLSEVDFTSLLESSGAFKERSDGTHDARHGPELANSPSGRIKLLLLGDSMLERFLTTGKDTKLGQIAFPTAFNAGVGGDRVSNVLFRVGMKGLFGALGKRGVDVAFLQMGTNDLRKKRSLDDKAVSDYTLVIEALRRASPGIQIVVGGVMSRADIGQDVVDQSNMSLIRLVDGINSESGSEFGTWISERLSRFEFYANSCAFSALHASDSSR